MKLLLLSGLILAGITSFAQTATTTTTTTTTTVTTNPGNHLSPDDTLWRINILKAPSSPGADLIGISPSDIQRPTDPSAFTVSLLNATNNLTVIPSSYAIDFAPAWLFKGQRITYHDFNSNTFKSNVWQTFDVSFAVKNVKDSLKANQTNTTVGFGVKVSLLRGTINSKANAQVARVASYTSNLNKFRSTAILAITARSGFNSLAVARKKALIDSVNLAVNTQYTYILDSLTNVVGNIDFRRVGWKLDAAAGISYYFSAQVYNSGKINNAGAWLTGGYEDESGVSLLAIARYLYNPLQAYADANNVLKQADLSAFDTGARLLYDTQTNKLTFGGEVVYRSILNSPVVKPSVRYTFTADYQIGKNQLISFVYGKDFDGTVNKGGNLLAALNFIIGFGNSRPVR